jgi:hypothetical protein
MNPAPSTPYQDPPSFKGMEDALRDACERAMQLVFPLPTMLRLYRSVVGLTRAVMQARKDVGLPPGLNDELIALLEKVRDTTGMHFPDPDRPMEDALCLHAAMMKLAAIAHRARAGRLFPSMAGWKRPRGTAEPEPAPPAEPEAETPNPTPCPRQREREDRPHERLWAAPRAEPEMRPRAKAAAG